METHPGEGVVKEEKFPNTMKPSHQQVCGEFWNLREQHNQEGKKKNTDYVPNCNSQWEVAQTLASASSKQGLNREARAACLGTGPECPKDNLRELM